MEFLTTYHVPIFSEDYSKPKRIFLREPVTSSKTFETYWKSGRERANNFEASKS